MFELLSNLIGFDPEKLVPAILVASVAGSALTFTASKFFEESLERSIRLLFSSFGFHPSVPEFIINVLVYYLSLVLQAIIVLFLISGLLLLPFILNPNGNGLWVSLSYGSFVFSLVLFLTLVISQLSIKLPGGIIRSDTKNDK